MAHGFHAGYPGMGMGRAVSRRPLPGAWSVDTPQQDRDGEGVVEADEPQQHRESRAKFAEVEELESVLAVKETELTKLRGKILLEQEEEAAEESPRAAGGNTTALKRASAEDEAQMVGLEIIGLERELQALRLEGDAAFARELAEEEARGRSY
jgi:hypothetical protein